MDFKAIFDNVANKAGSLAKSAARKTGEVAEQAKLAITAKSEKGKLETMYTTLGKLFYEQVKGTDVRAQVSAQIMEIDEQKLVIEQLTTEMAENNGHILCDGCGKEISFDDAFCPTCGKKQEPKKLFDREASTDEKSDTESEDFVEAFKDVTDKYFS